VDIFTYQRVSEEFINKHDIMRDKYIDVICQYQILSEKFIDKYIDNQTIWKYQKVSASQLQKIINISIPHTPPKIEKYTLEELSNIPKLVPLFKNVKINKQNEYLACNIFKRIIDINNVGINSCIIVGYLYECLKIIFKRINANSFNKLDVFKHWHQYSPELIYVIIKHQKIPDKLIRLINFDVVNTIYSRSDICRYQTQMSDDAILQVVSKGKQQEKYITIVLKHQTNISDT